MDYSDLHSFFHTFAVLEDGTVVRLDVTRANVEEKDVPGLEGRAWRAIEEYNPRAFFVYARPPHPRCLIITASAPFRPQTAPYPAALGYLDSRLMPVLHSETLASAARVLGGGVSVENPGDVWQLRRAASSLADEAFCSWSGSRRRSTFARLRNAVVDTLCQMGLAIGRVPGSGVRAEA